MSVEEERDVSVAMTLLLLDKIGRNSKVILFLILPFPFQSFNTFLSAYYVPETILNAMHAIVKKRNS